jgi:hypothetical protein
MDPNRARLVDRARRLNLNEQPAKSERTAETNTANPNNQHERPKLPQTRQRLWR